MPTEPANLVDESATRTIADIPCPFCSCLCDDLVATVQGDKIVSIAGACELARPWFVGKRPSSAPECRVDDRPADVNEAIGRAAELLAAARYPLVYGLSRATCEAQRIAVEIAQLLEGVLDVPINRGGLEALQSVGEVSCTFGETRNRADLIVVWNADLATTHPRFVERFLRRGRQPADSSRRVITIETDMGASPTSFADERVVAHAEGEFDVVTTLRSIVKGVSLDSSIVVKRTGIALDKWRNIADQMRQARFGILITATPGDDSAGVRTRQALAALVRELSEHTRFALVDLPSAPNVVGAANVVAWRTGYAPAIDFWRGDPTSNAAEFSVQKLLDSRDTDAVLVICDDLVSRLDQSAERSLAPIAVIAVDWRQTATMSAARIAIPVALPGVESGGTIFRGDGVPLALRPPIKSQLVADDKTLQSLKTAIGSRKLRTVS